MGLSPDSPQKYTPQSNIIDHMTHPFGHKGWEHNVVMVWSLAHFRACLNTFVSEHFFSKFTRPSSKL